jgi:hypothetical protein
MCEQQAETKQQEERRQETEPEIFRQHLLSLKITRALRTTARGRRQQGPTITTGFEFHNKLLAVSA